MISSIASAQGVIDVHSHIITTESTSALEQENRLMEEGFPLPGYDAKSHLKWMDEAGIQTSVLTLAAPQPTSAKVVRATNEPDLAPFKEMILHKNAEWLWGISGLKPTKDSCYDKMIVRIAEIEVYPEYLDEYLSYANDVDRLSMEHEPGVICLFPMQSAEDSTHIRILEIYASESAYQQHLNTEHFKKYKQGTLHMVKSLKLPNLKPLDPSTMNIIFRKNR